ncbi:Hypothetical protein MSYG_3052 [Malassezia sympodialis ATCC 42132]|uniref:Uncharacterized protein n=1 Tax=Malassezia sympodialis (strain ATCC 42132) TaxID=1230383 RepID=A0A1M8A888_MALS4|nr:Hypothetical protein MSYG_3052 [Malassezia sympodialis ATCC 42132]
MDRFETLCERLLDNIFHEGVNSTTHELMNWIFYALFACLSTLLLASGFNLHVLALLLLAVGVFLSINWFISEIRREAERKEAVTNKSQ